MKWENGDIEFFTEEDGQLLDIVPTGDMDNSGHHNNLTHYIDILTKGGEPCFKPQQGVDMIKILCAVYESAKTGKEVVL